MNKIKIWEKQIKLGIWETFIRTIELIPLLPTPTKAQVKEMERIYLINNGLTEEDIPRLCALRPSKVSRETVK